MNLGLTREDFSFEAAKTFRSLFDQADFCDVTLVSEDQKQILAHKVILASGSPFFKNIFLQNPHPKPLMYLRVKFSDLQEIVSFIYTGQCKVAQNELDGFLEIAKSLEIVGIATDEDVKVTQIANDDELENVNGRATAISAVFENLNFDENKQIDDKKDSLTRKEETDKLYKVKEETEKAGLYCNECDKIFSSTKSLSSHKWVHNTKRIRDAGTYFPEVYVPFIFSI